MTRNLKDMVVVITGASAGIGKALAVALDAKGTTLVLSARRLELLESLNARLGGRHFCVRADVSKREECEMLIARAVERFGRIDTLVCNAGYTMFRRVDELSADEFAAMFQTNLFGTTDCIRAAVPRMSKQQLRDGWRGQIMIVSSAAARRGLPYAGAYSATKSAQLSIAEAARVELSPLRIAVTSIHPGATESDIFSMAESLSGRALHPPGTHPHRDPVERVIRGMVRAIERPKREVWSSLKTRLLIPLCAYFPIIGDWAMSRERAEFERINNIPSNR